MFSAVVRDFACFRAFSKSRKSAPRAPPNSSLAPLESARTKLSNGARLVVWDARGATCWEFETRKKWSMLWARFRQKHENFRKNYPGSPRFFCFKHFFRSLSTCGSLKICCNFQWVLVVVRDVEKASEIESEGLQKKAFFFTKHGFQRQQNDFFARNSCFFRVLSALRLLRALWFPLFPVVFQTLHFRRVCMEKVQNL